MKPNPSRQNGAAFANLRASLSRLNVPPDLVDELIDRHITVSYEKGAWAFCEGNTDGMVAYIISGYVNVYCPVGDGNRTLIRMAGPGEVIGYPDYVDERGQHRAHVRSPGCEQMHAGALQPRSLGAVAGPSSDRWIDHDPYGTEYFLVRRIFGSLLPC